MFTPTPRQIEALALLSSPARHIMLEGGSRSGKTAIIIYTLVVRCHKAPKTNHAIFRHRLNHAKMSIWLDTLPKVCAAALPPEAQPEWNHAELFLTFANGSRLFIGGLDDKNRTEKVLGQEHSSLYFNETSQISFSAVEMALSRLAQKSTLVPKAYYDQNPAHKKHWSYVLFHEKLNPEDRNALRNPDQYAWMQLHPRHNEQNLSPGYIEDVLSNLSARKRKRFLDGEYSDDVDGALWTGEMIAATRVTAKPANLKKVCIAVDPAVTSNPESNETGIIARGMDSKGHLYAWRDDTCLATPARWARAAVDAYYEEEADAIVCETNQGGDLVEMNIKNVDKDVRVVQVHATRGKYVRAEPIAALMEPDSAGRYTESRDHIVGEMPDLETELTGWSPVDDAASPNRLDAYVWGAHWLLGTHKHAGTWGTREFHQENARPKVFVRRIH